jgi:hypothetical protein
MRGALISLMLVVSQSAPAADWVHVGLLDADGSKLEIDASSVAKVGNKRKAWSRWTYVNPEKVPSQLVQNESSRTFYTVSLVLSFYNCAERTMADKQGIYRDSKGDVIAQFTNGEFLQYSEVAPETVGELMLEYVCGKRLGAPATPSAPKPVAPPK